jgi:hypothetical protein
MNFLLSITPWPVLSALLWIVLIVTALYLARSTAHNAIRAAASALHRGFQLASRAVSKAETNLRARNREVLLAAGREAKERVVEREFDRVHETVRKDLANYSALHRSLSDSITRIEEDHRDAVEVPPDPPGWVKAVEAVAKIDSREGRVGVGNVLGDIHKSLVKAHHEAMVAYRDASAKRHALLHRMRPEWRRLQQTLGHVGRNVDSLLERSVTIDRHMKEYEEIVRGTDRAVSVLSSSSLVYFFVSMLVLLVAIGGATINFSLIARPMAEMVGGTSLIGGVPTAHIAALVIIMVEISMGLFLMESLRITRLFPVIGALPDKVRIRMVWITTAAQMGMGFILPFALTFVAIPLETFVHSVRTVVGLAGLSLLRVVSLLLRLLGNTCRYVGTLAEHVYDLPLFIPLWLEARHAAGPGDSQNAPLRRVRT